MHVDGYSCCQNTAEFPQGFSILFLNFFSYKSTETHDTHNHPVPRDPKNRVPVLRVLIVRVTGTLALQVGVAVLAGGVGVVAVLVDLIQTPNESTIFRFNMNLGPLLHDSDDSKRISENAVSV